VSPPVTPAAASSSTSRAAPQPGPGLLSLAFAWGALMTSLVPSLCERDELVLLPWSWPDVAPRAAPARLAHVHPPWCARRGRVDEAGRLDGIFVFRGRSSRGARPIFEQRSYRHGTPDGVWLTWSGDEVLHQADLIGGHVVRGAWPAHELAVRTLAGLDDTRPLHGRLALDDRSFPGVSAGIDDDFEVVAPDALGCFGER